MMARHRRLGRRLLGSFGLVMTATLVAAFCQQTSERVTAAPYTVRRVAHPYDPDWPDVYLIIARKCASCHREGAEIHNLTSYESILSAHDPDGVKVVIPGKPEASALWQGVVWNVEGLPDSDLPESPMMPDKSSEWLTRGQIETIARWIRNGALQYKLPSTCSPRPLLEIDFPSAKECQACHPRQYEQWSRSMHHYAQHSPIFEAFNQTLLERTGGTMGTFCSRCHTPLGTALGENGLRRNVHRSRLSMEGVTCVVCHRQSRPYYKSNARQAIEPGKLLDTCMYGPFEDSVVLKGQATHPAKGAARLRTSAFCGGCHDVTNPQGVRLEEAFSEWQNSPAAKAGITCQECHMGPVQGVPIPANQRPLGRAAEVPGVEADRIPLRPLTDHTFAGPDYSILPDTEFPFKLDWMYETDYRDFDRLTAYQQKTLNDLRRKNRRQLRIANNKRYELLSQAAKISVAAPGQASCGSKIKVRVDVTNRVSGHNFPTGFTAERQAWVEIVVRDPLGRVVFISGDRDSNGDLRDASSHDVETRKISADKYLLNFQNKFAALTQKGTDRTVILSVNRDLQPLNFLRPAAGISASYGHPPAFRIAKASIPPLATIGRNYPVQLGSLPGDYRLDVKLNFRHIPPDLLDSIGIPHLKHLLEIVVLDEYHGVIRVPGE